MTQNIGAHGHLPGMRQLVEYLSERGEGMTHIDNALRLGRHMIMTRDTLGKIAKEHGLSVSTVRRYINKVLPEVNPEMAKHCKVIIDYHKAVRHIRGGEATRIKYRKADKA